jgi:urease beta subunit
MLGNMRTGLAAFATVACLGGTAIAEDHEVVIVEGAYFPSLIIANLGDRLVFVNSSNRQQEVGAVDASWTSGKIEIGQTYVQPIEVGTGLVFIGKNGVLNSNSDTGIGVEQMGEVVIDATGVSNG